METDKIPRSPASRPEAFYFERTPDKVHQTSRIDRDDLAERILVVYASVRHSRPAAEALALALRANGFVAEVADAGMRGAPPPFDYDAIVFAVPLRLGGYPSSVAEYIRLYRDELAAMPAWFITLARSGAAKAARLLRATGWTPRHVASFALPSVWRRWFDESISVLLQPRAHELARVIADGLPLASAS